MKKLRGKLIAFLVILMAVLIGFGVTYYIRSSKTKVENEPTNVTQKKDDNKPEIVLKKYETPESVKKELKEKFDKLLGINKDTIGYIYAPGTQLDEPIVQTTDNEKYLNVTFEGENVPFLGSVFMDYENSKNFNDPLTWLFGHARGSKVVDHRMFNDVNFYENQQYMDEHPFVVVETPERKHYYTVEFLIKVPEVTDLYRVDFADAKEFDEHIKKAASQALVVANGAKMEGTSNYLILSTCREDNVEIRTNLYCREVSDYELEDFLKKYGDKLEYKSTR